MSWLWQPLPAAQGSGDVSLDGTGTQLTLTGGTATFTLSMSATGSQATLTGGAATFQLATVLSGTGSQLTLTGGTATFEQSLSASGSALALTGGDATFSTAIVLDAQGSQLSLTGGEATFDLTGEAPEAPQTERGTPTADWSGYVRQEQEALRRAYERKKKEQEEEELRALADRLEAHLIETGVLEPPDDVARLRALVAQYREAEGLPNRVARAIEYADRAQTEMALALAEREIRKMLEEEELAVLLLLTLAA